MFAAPIIALGLASFAAAAPVSSSSEAYVSTYIPASEVWTSRFANATYTANATVTVAELTVTVTVTPTSTSSYVSSSASASASSSAVASSASSTSEWVSPSSSSSTSEWIAPSSTSSTSEWVAPSTSSTSEWVAPSSSAAVYQAAAVPTTSTSTWSPAPAASSAAPVNSGDFHGTATYYYQNGNPGSCGNWNSDSVHIVAVNSAQQSGTCGKTITITNEKNGKTMTALCADTCPTCSYGSLDLSSGLFSALGDGDMGQGTFPISWSFN